MAEPGEKKAMLGHKVRRFRREQGLSQSEMAEQLGISASYLNLIEHNQRPVTVQTLFRLAQAFAVDLRAFAEDDEARLAAGLKEVFADPLFEGQRVRDPDIRDLAQASPEAAQAVLGLYQAYRDLREELHGLADRLDERGRPAALDSYGQAVEQVREHLQAHDNHFPELEAAAEALAADARLGEDGTLFHDLARHLEAEHGIGAKTMPVDVMGATLRRFDLHRRRILLSELLPPWGRSFQLAQQFALLARRELLDRMVAEAGLSGEADRLLRGTYAGYFAGALMMPYDRFLEAARTLRHDLDVLQQRFSAGFEQVCHRLTTLGRAGQRGVPFFFVRVDVAGNVSKRLSGAGFRFALFGGNCPRFAVHDAFRTPGSPVVQLAEMPDGAQFFVLARTVEPLGGHRQAARPRFAVALGCEARFAGDLVYADDLDLKRPTAATPVGASCRVCERLDCTERAFPPLNQKVRVEENVRRLAPFGLHAG